VDGLEFDSRNSNLISLKDIQFIHVIQWSSYGGIKKRSLLRIYLQLCPVVKADRSIIRSISLLKKWWVQHVGVPLIVLD